MSDGTSTAAIVDNLVKESEGIICLDASCHALPQISDLPVSRRFIAACDEGFGNFDHDGGIAG